MAAQGDLFETRRRMLVAQLHAAGIRDSAVLAAFASVPRERFVPPELVEFAYDDEALGIGRGQTISQPYIVARMTELLHLVREAGLAAPNEVRGETVGGPRGGGAASETTHVPPRALDVGTGSGYQAAILAAMGVEVVSIERDPELSRAAAARLAEIRLGGRIACVLGDGSEGWPPGAPYDGIVVGAAAPDVPAPLLDQLADGGRLVIPVGPRGEQSLHVCTRVGDRIDERISDPCVFVPLVGRYGFA